MDKITLPEWVGDEWVESNDAAVADNATFFGANF